MAEPFALPPGWGSARLGAVAPAERIACAAPPPRVAGTPHASVRAYDHAGARLQWEPGPAGDAAEAVACDLEHRDRFRDESAPQMLGLTLAIETWVASEVLAKLLDIPILAFVKHHGLVSPGAERHLRLDLARYGAAGGAEILLIDSADGAQLAGFGMRFAQWPAHPA